MSQISKISINGTEYNLSEKLSSYYTSYSEPALPAAGDSVETAISKLHTDVELISRLGYLSEDYTAYETILYEGPQPDDSIELAISKLHRVILDNEQVVSASLIDLNEKIETVADNAGNAYLSENYTAYQESSLGVEPQPNDSIELAISKLHKVIIDDEYAISSSLIDLNEKSFHILHLNYTNNSYVLYDENNNEIPLDGSINLYNYVNEHSIIKYHNLENNTEREYYYTEYYKFISIDNQTIYWIEFTSGQQGNYIIQTGQQPIESQFINSTAYNISQSDITNWNNKLDSFTETDPTVASYIKAITQSDITNWNSKTSNVGTITGITMNGASKGTSGVVDLGTVITDISYKADTSAAIGSLSLSMNSSTYVITLSGAKVDGTTFTVNDSIDLPLESVVVDGEYNSTTKKVVLTLKSGSTVEFSIADLINGLQSEITSTNKLSADLISNGTTNKTVTQTEKNTWNSKLDSFTETDPTVASYIKSITQSDITYWNSKTSNVGTITGITMNNVSKGTSGVVDLGTVVVSETDPTVASYIKAITQSDITNWNNKLDSFTETDPTVASYIKSITQSDITNWNSKTSNVGTITGITMNGTSKGTSGVVNLGTVVVSETDPTVASYIKAITQSDITNWNNKLDSFTETDPIFSASTAATITSTDITNWNSKTSNVGTITGITMNGTSKGTSGVVNLGTVVVSETDPTVASYIKAITQSDITNWNNKLSTAPVTSVNGQTGAVSLTIPTVSDSTVTITMNGNTVGTFTLNKSGNTTIDLGTVLTSHQSIKTVNSQSLTGTGNISINELPTVTSSDNGKVLMVVNGAWALVNPVTLYSGSGTPSNAQGNNGDLYVQS